MLETAERQLLNLATFENAVFDGTWLQAEKRQTIKEPATGKVLTVIGNADVETLNKCLAKARTAQLRWSTHDCEAKRKLLIRAAQLLEKHAHEISDIAMREIGATRAKAQFEISFSIDEFLEASSYPTQQHGQILADRRNRHSYSRRLPYGVVAALTPSNVPILLAARVIAPALALGNAVVLKPHPHSVISGGFVFARILEEAGFPDGIFQVLPTAGPDAETFETSPQVDMVHFTGSSATGAKIAEIAGRSLKKVSISGSGKNPLIVLNDVPDLDAAVTTAIFSTFYFGGQSCMTAGRHLIQKSIHKDYVEKLAAGASKLRVGNPVEDESVFYGPMIDPTAVGRLKQLVDDAVSKGAKLELGGTHEGPFFHPTVLTGVNSSMRVWSEEIFGPIAAITSFDRDEEAIAMANDTEYGLSGAVLGSLERARAIADQMKTGMVHINDKSTDDCAYVPFGGVKLSGNGGRYGSTVNWDEYTYVRWVTESSRTSNIEAFE